MLSKAQIKYIRSLTQQKYRKEHNVFIAEGDKICQEWLGSNASIAHVVCLQDWAEANQGLIRKHPEATISIIDDTVLSSISTLQSPNKVLLVVGMPLRTKQPPVDQWAIALDHLQDPGNMGTIIRIADWFGIENIICSKDCVDIYNPKVVQAAMGGHIRIKFYEADLLSYISKLTIPVLAATLDGESLYSFGSFEKAVLLIGNESKGLSEELIVKASHKITIPRRGGAESLNAAVSTGILCSALLPH
jgi:TrmH family RNA methyltransferase